MRIKSNYGSIDPYLVAQISDDDHRIFNRALCTVGSATVGLLELYIGARIGKAESASIARDFISTDSSGISADTLQTRLSSYGF